MRTVTLMGLVAIADAINKNWGTDSVYKFYAVVLIIAFIMDIIDFTSKKHTK
jgi:hypothetical protein